MDVANVATSGPAARAADELSERDQQILSFERLWWKYAGAKEQAVREQFAMSATRYYQVLNALIDRPLDLLPVIGLGSGPKLGAAPARGGHGQPG